MTECLGLGGFSAVFRGVHTKSGETCALKIALDARPRTLARFTREALYLKRLGPASAPAWIDDGLMPDGRPFVAMELLQGQTLSSWLQQPLPRLLEMGLDIAALLGAALERCHRLGIVHGDLKPANIWLEKDSKQVRLLDFGLSFSMDEGFEAGQEAGGTPAYLAPERWGRERKLGPAVDIYAFGVILYELLSGHPPFWGSLHPIEQGHRLFYPPPLPCALPKELRGLVMACLRKYPEERPGSWSEIESVLNSARAGAAHQELPPLQTQPSLAGPDSVEHSELPTIQDSVVFDGESPSLWGRNAIVKKLERLVPNQTGEAAFLWLLGDEGMGKSRLLKHFIERIKVLWTDAELLSLVPGDVRNRIPYAGELQRPLIVALDDAHLAPDPLLHALDELASEDKPELPRRLVLIASEPRLEKAKPTLGKRASRYLRIGLSPLDEADSKAMLSELLLPADYVPDALLSEWHALTGGIPSCIAALASALKKAIARRPNKESFYLSTVWPELLEQAALWPWIAEIELSDLSKPLVFAIQVCAQLNPLFEWKEAEFALLSLQETRYPLPVPDARAALKALSAAGFLKALSGGSFAFRHPAIRHSIGAALNQDWQRHLNQGLLSYWNERLSAEVEYPATALEHISIYAKRLGRDIEALEAMDARIELAREALHHVRVDSLATQALAMLSGDRVIQHRARLLFLRGQARYHLHRLDEALLDLEEAAKEAIPDSLLWVRVRLEQATALDWAGNIKASAQYANDAAIRLEGLEGKDKPQLQAQAIVALGRSAWREGDVPKALVLLEQGAVLAEQAGEEKAWVIAFLLVACALVHVRRLEDAKAAFDRVIDRCTARNDFVHLSAAYGNRFFLWSHEANLERGISDVELSLFYARKAGNPWPERAATFNLAELFYWAGRSGEALRLALRTLCLEERFMQTPSFEGHLLLARLRAARGEWNELGPPLAWISAHCDDSIQGDPRILFQALQTLLAYWIEQPSAGQVKRFLESIRAYVSSLSGTWPEERMEVLLWWSRWMSEAGYGDSAKELWEIARPLCEQYPRLLTLLTSYGGWTPQASAPR